VPSMPEHITRNTEIIFTSEERFTHRDLNGLWALCGVEVMHVYHFMDAVLKTIEENPCQPDTIYLDMDMP